MGKRALITGATGFVGANLTRRLLADGHQVAVLIRPGRDAWRLAEVAADLQWLEADLTDTSSLDAAVAQFRPEWVFHLAVYGAYADQRQRGQIMSTNVSGTAGLLDACVRHGFEAFVNTGSSSEYGRKTGPASEGDPLEPETAYAWSKAASTLYCRQRARELELPVTTLRLYSVYGPYEEPRRLMPVLILRGLDGAWPPLVSPDVAHDFVYVDDVVEAYLLAARAQSCPGAIYNVGTGVQTMLGELVELAGRVLQIRAEPVWGTMPDRAWDTATWLADRLAIEHELGWRPGTTLAAGFRAFVDWFRSAPDMVALYRKRLAT